MILKKVSVGVLLPERKGGRKAQNTELKPRTGTWAVCALWVIKADFGQ